MLGPVKGQPELPFTMIIFTLCDKLLYLSIHSLIQTTLREKLVHAGPPPGYEEDKDQCGKRPTCCSQGGS